MTDKSNDKPTTSTFDFSALIDGVQCTHSVRVVTLEGKPWFVAVDACRALGFKVARGTTNQLRHLDAEDKCLTVVQVNGRGTPHALVVSESGLYKLIMRSDKAQAKPFQDWVTREVLPSIRKTGGYQLGAGETMPLPTSFAESLRQYAATIIKLADEQEQHAKTQAERDAAIAAKAQAEAELLRVTPLAAVGSLAVQFERTLARFVRTLDGVNTMATKRDLARLGYLYRAAGSNTYRVYAKFRGTLFTEKAVAEYGTYDICPTADGQALLLQLYRNGMLTMLKGRVPAAA